MFEFNQESGPGCSPSEVRVLDNVGQLAATKQARKPWIFPSQNGGKSDKMGPPSQILQKFWKFLIFKVLWQIQI